MTNEELMNMMTDMGLHEGVMEKWVMDKGWVEVANDVAAHERENVAKWMVERGYATGHGDTVEDLLTEIDWQAAEREREECAKICDDWPNGRDDVYSIGVAIRARGKK